MKKILLIGSADTATATAIRLMRAGYAISLLDDVRGLDLFGYRNFNVVPVLGMRSVAGITAMSAAGFMQSYSAAEELSTLEFIRSAWANRVVPFISPLDISQKVLDLMDYIIICDDLLNDVLARYTLPMVLAPDILSASFNGYRVYATGQQLGMVAYPFLDAAPQDIAVSTDVDLHAAGDGVFYSFKSPGDAVQKNDVLGNVNEMKIACNTTGFISGQMRSGAFVGPDQIVLRISREKSSLGLPFESYAMAGGFLEAILYDQFMKKS